MILIIDKSKKNAESLAELIHFTGYLAYGATPTEALSEISSPYRAVIITDPERLPDPRDLCSRLHSYVSGIPIFAITDSACPSEYGFAAVFKRNELNSSIATKIARHTDSLGLPSPGRYTLFGVDASAELATPTYFWTSLPFTKTETAILRTLIRAYPLPFDSERILRYAYRQSRVPESSNIRTHISVINRKFKEITGRALFTLVAGEGYTVLTPELELAKE